MKTKLLMLGMVMITTMLFFTSCSKDEVVIVDKQAAVTPLLKAVMSGGTYSIIAKNSGKALDVTGASTADGAKIIQWTNTNANNQHWVVTSLGSNAYSIVSVNSGKSLDVTGGSTANGAKIIQWTSHGGNNQRWNLNVDAQGYYTIVSVASGKAIDVAGGSTADGDSIIQWTVNNGDNQKFSFVSVGGTPQPPSPPALSSGVLDNFINTRVSYAEGSATSQRSVIGQILQEMGGDVFVTNLLRKDPDFFFYITSTDNGLYSNGGKTYIYKGWWDSNAKYRVGATIHEFTHNYSDGASADAYWQAAVNNPAKQWDQYALNNHAEFIASGCSWVVNGGIDDASGEDCRDRMYRMQPDFYLWLINEYIPNRMYKNFTGQP